jgi:hypothetical protein
MANQSSPTGRTFTRHVVPFAPLALALAMNAVPPSPSTPSETETPTGIVAAKCEEVTDSQDCHSRYKTGCSAAGGYDAYLNFWKNQLIPPASSSNPVKYFTQLQDYQKLDASIPSGLTRSNQGDYQDQLKQLGEGQLYGVIGYLYYAQHTSAESSNCDLTGPPGDPEFGNVDYHIGIGFEPPPTTQQTRADTTNTANEAASAPGARRKSPPKKPTTSGSGASILQQNSIIVEMTPHDRFQYENGIWTLENLQKAVGRQVKIVGQLIIDNEHNLPSQNCATATTASQRQTCWRASVWELHPVVTFQVCPNDSCTQDSTNWVELDQLQ